MKSGFECPYCSMVMSLTDDTLIRRYPSFDNDNSCYYMVNSYSYSDSCIEIAYYKCPNCGEYTVKAKGKGKCVTDIDENEAISLIKLIEHLMKEWYINREERNCFQIYYHQINPNKEYERKLSRILLSCLVYGYYREKSYSIEISFNQYQIRYYQYGTNLK